MRRGVFLFCLIALGLFAYGAVAAPPTIDVRPALTSYLVEERWQSLVVTLTNPSTGSAIDGEIQVNLVNPRDGESYGVYTRPVTLPAGAGSVQVPVVIGMQENSQPDIKVYLVAGKEGSGDILTRRTFTKIPIRPVQPVLVAVTAQPDALQYLGGEQLGVDVQWATLRRVQPGHSGPPAGSGGYGVPPYLLARQAPTQASPFVVTNLPTPQNLPDNAAAYDVACIVYLGPDVVPDAFTDRQVDALRQWVNCGGCLVVGRTDMADPKLRHDERFRTWIPPYPSPVAAELLAHQRLGLGNVFALGYDPTTLPPEKGLPLWRSLAQEAVVPISIARFTADGNDYGSTIASAASFVPGTEAPGIAYIGAFLVLYIALLIPINYLILKRLKRREWAWATIPLLVLAFSAGAYGFGYATKGAQLIVNTASIVEMGAGSGETIVAGAVGIFSPARARYRVTMQTPDSLVGTLTYAGYMSYNNDSGQGLILAEGDKTADVRNADVSMWAMRSLQVRTQALRLGDGIAANLRTIGPPSHWSRIEGTITNRTGHTLTDVVVRRGEIGQQIGTLAPNQTVRVAIDRLHHGYVSRFGIPASRPNYGRRLTEDERRQQARAELAGAVEQSGIRNLPGFDDGLILCGWLEEPFLPVTVDGRTVNNGTHANLVIVRLAR